MSTTNYKNTHYDLHPEIYINTKTNKLIRLYYKYKETNDFTLITLNNDLNPKAWAVNIDSNKHEPFIVRLSEIRPATEVELILFGEEGC